MSNESAKAKKANTGVNFGTRKFLHDAQGRADRLGLSLSRYIVELIANDLEKGGPLAIRERPEMAANSTEADVAGELKKTMGHALDKISDVEDGKLVEPRLAHTPKASQGSRKKQHD